MAEANRVVEWFMAPCDLDYRTFFKLALCGAVVLIFLYYLSYQKGAYGPSSAGRRRVTVKTLYSNSAGPVWPRKNDDNDRIMSQIDAMNVYARHQKRHRTLKVILLVGKLNFEMCAAGQEPFSKCPIVDCWLTRNTSQAPSADALLISEFRYSDRSLYLPKPRRQIWIAQHMEPPPPRYSHIDPRSLRGLINWTASYRRDSTIVFRYDMMVPGVPANTTQFGPLCLVGKDLWFIILCWLVRI